MTSSISGDQTASRYFREVLGHFPTGVVVVTAMDDSGNALGMAVGSFTSVSLDPPLIAFLPAVSSTSFPRIQATGHFCVNVLSADQEGVCRAFATRKGDKFEGIEWTHAPSGSPILHDTVAWIDCRLEAIHEAGDHFIVIGRVQALEIVNPTFPLLFFQGGYGSFSPRSLVIGAREDLTEQIRLADLARAEMERLAERLELGCSAIAIASGRQVVVATAGTPEWSDSIVGVSMPMIPPFGEVFLAWSSEPAVEAWFDSSPFPLERERKEVLLSDMRSIRAHGWMLGMRNAVSLETTRTLESLGRLGQTPSLERRLFEIAQRTERRSDPSLLVDDAAAAQVNVLLAPVFDRDGGVALAVMVRGFPDGASLASIRKAKDALVEATGRITASLARGGRGAPAIQAADLRAGG